MLQANILLMFYFTYQGTGIRYSTPFQAGLKCHPYYKEVERRSSVQNLAVSFLGAVFYTKPEIPKIKQNAPPE